MGNGLSITVEQFKKLPEKEKWSVLYENQVATLNLMKGYKFKQYIQWAWLLALTTIGLYLIRALIS